MKIEVWNREGVTVLVPKGKITIGEGDVMFRRAVAEALEAGVKNILINLEGISTMDSSGVGELVSAYTTVTNRGGQLKLACLPAKIFDILQVTQLVTVFDVFDEVDEGIAAF